MLEIILVLMWISNIIIECIWWIGMVYFYKLYANLSKKLDKFDENSDKLVEAFNKLFER